VTKILINGQKDFGNRGCEALVRSVVKLIKLKYTSSTIYVPSSNIKLDEKQYPDFKKDGVIFIPYFYPTLLRYWIQFLRIPIGFLQKINFPFIVPKKIKNIYNEVDKVISLGGDMYTYEGRITAWIHGMDNLAINIFNKPINLISASISDFNEVPHYQKHLKKHFSKFSNIIVREKISYDIVRHTFEYSNVKNSPDIAFLLDKKEVDIESFWPEKNSKKVVGINISPLFQKLSKKSSPIDAMKLFIDDLIQSRGFNVLLVPHVFSLEGNINNNDLIFMKKIIKDLGDYDGRLSIVDKQLNAQEIKYVISKCNFFIGARMHSTIAAVSTLVPTLFLSYSNKGVGMSKFIYNEMPLYITLDNFSRNALNEKFNLLEDNHIEIKDMLKEKMPIIVDKIKSDYYKIL